MRGGRGRARVRSDGGWSGSWLACGLALLVAAPATAAGGGAGPELREAFAAFEGGELERADELLRQVALRHPIVADHADLLRMRVALERGDLASARGFEPLWSVRESPLRGRFYTLLGRAQSESGSERGARAAWETALVETRDRERLAALGLEIAESHRREGQRQAAADRFLDLWTRYADLPEGRRAGEVLDQFENPGRSLRTASHFLARADALYRRYHNEGALEAYERALDLGLAASDRARARHQRAETLFRLRRYPEASKAFAALPPSDGRRIQLARAEARAGRVSEGALMLEELGESKRGSQAVRAVYLAGLLWDGLDDERAGRLFEQVIRRAPNSSYAADSRWWLGWHAYRDGRLESAERHFADLARRESDPVSALRPRYWLARTRERTGAGDAQQRYAELAREFPFSYYGWRALERLAAPVEWRRPPALSGGTRRLRPWQLERPRILLEAGLVAEAREELAALFERARGLDDRLELASLYAETGAFDRAQRLVVNAYSETLARGPAPGYEELWWHAWPAPFPRELARVQDQGGPEAPIVYSIMREESGYRPEVMSVVGARGLLQLMPKTAERVAASLGQPEFDPERLFDPAVNIELGSAYLRQLLGQFAGYRSAAIGSYNAGPEAVRRWLREPPLPDDEWVEQIPYGQTRAYVKRVLRSLHVYRVLY